MGDGSRLLDRPSRRILYRIQISLMNTTPARRSLASVARYKSKCVLGFGGEVHGLRHALLNALDNPIFVLQRKWSLPFDLCLASWRELSEEVDFVEIVQQRRQSNCGIQIRIPTKATMAFVQIKGFSPRNMLFAERASPMARLLSVLESFKVFTQRSQGFFQLRVEHVPVD
jgi:hypothetical protein